MSSAVIVPEKPVLSLSEKNFSRHATRTHPHIREWLSILVVLIADGLALCASLQLALFVSALLTPHWRDGMFFAFHSSNYRAYAGAWLTLVTILGAEGLYTQRRAFWCELSHLVKTVSLALTAVLAVVALTSSDSGSLRLTILLAALSLFAFLPLERYWVKRTLGALGFWRKPVLVLGATSLAKLAMRGVTSDPVLGFEIAGLLDDDPAKIGKCAGDQNGRPLFILGNLSQARELMERMRIKDVLIAMPEMPEAKLQALLRDLQPCCDSIFVVPQLWALPVMTLQVEGLLPERVMMLKLSNNLAKSWNASLKRAVDLLLGAVIALLTLPLCLLLAVLIRLDSPGPALFVQDRIGYRRGTFRCLKFRTMILNGEEKLKAYLDANPLAAEEWQRYAKLRNYDPRLTRLGHFLRRWSLDELPQLWNILKGEMSLIGPRPYLPRERERIGDELAAILSARPGLTGFWQVNGRNHVTLDGRIQLEAWYVRNWTPWLDLIILAKTFKVVLFPDNRHRTCDQSEQHSLAHTLVAEPLVYRHHA